MVGVVGDELIQRIGTWFPIRVVRRYLAVSGYLTLRAAHRRRQAGAPRPAGYRPVP